MKLLSRCSTFCSEIGMMLRMDYMVLRNIVRGTLLLLSFLCTVDTAFALEISSRYRSPRNPERKVRRSTELIVLHTTEAPARSSLNKVSERGECHFCVTEEGGIYRIVDREREAFHAGRSMWNGREDVDKYSVGIECVGYHNKAMGRVQLCAIRDLVKYLQGIYRIPDERVVCHSHVAYGAPNRWHRQRHRGRKRCGMLFAMPSVRRILRLNRRPAYDADLRARRLVIGDSYLHQVLYGNVDTMIAAYRGASAPVAVAKAPAKAPMSVASVKKALPKSMPARSAKPLPVKSAVSASARIPTSVVQLKKLGYSRLGVVSKNCPPIRIVGAKWNAADTFYVIRNKVIPGNRINASHVEKGMSIWRKR